MDSLPAEPPGKPENTGVGSLSLLQGIFLTQELNQGLLPCDFPGGSDGKASACNTGDSGLIPELGRSPGEGNGKLLQYSHLENSMDRVTCWATMHEVAKSLTQLSTSFGEVIVTESLI